MNKIAYNTLTKSNLKLSKLGLGTAPLAGLFQELPNFDAFNIIN